MESITAGGRGEVSSRINYNIMERKFQKKFC